MYINPFVLKRKNNIPKKDLYKYFCSVSFENLKKQEDKCSILKTSTLKHFQNIINYENKSTVLPLIRSIKGLKLNKILKIRNDRYHNLDSYSLVLLDEFVAELRNLEDENKKIKNKYFLEMNNTREKISEQLYNNEFAKNTLLINPSIYYRILSYRENDIKVHNKKDRKIELTIYNYLTRTIMKTSPFSTLTTVSRTDDEGISVDVSINFTFIYKIAFHYLYSSNKFIENTKYVVAPLSTQKANGSYYVTFIVSLSDSSSKKILFSTEGTKRIKVTREIYGFFEKIKLDDRFGVDDIVNLFNENIKKNDVIKLLKKLVNESAIIPSIGFDESSSTKLINDILDKTKNIIENNIYLDLYNDLNFFRKKIEMLIECETVDDFKNILDDLEEKLKLTNNMLSTEYRANDIFYIDSYVNDNNIDNNSIYKCILEKIDSNIIEKIQKFNLIFDSSVRLNYELKKRIKESFKDEHISLDHNFCSLLFLVSKDMIKYWNDFKYIGGNFFRSSEVHVLDELKVRFMNEINELIHGNNMSEIDIEPLISKYIKEIPKHILNNEINSTFFLQLKDNVVIVNNCYEGNEKYSARFMNYYKDYLDNSSLYRKFVNEHYIKNNYYEVKDTYGFNGNVKGVFLDNQCYTIGLGNTRFHDEFIERYNAKKIESFKVVNDDTKNYLIDYDNSLRNYSKLCLRGSLTPALLPSYISVLLQLFSFGAMYYRTAEFIKSLYIPRIMIGNFVISRAMVRMSALPNDFRKSNRENNEDYFIRINKIFNANKLFKEFFIKIDKSSESDYGKRQFKPIYINIENPFSCNMFTKIINGFGVQMNFENIFLEEILGNDGEYAEEIQVEFYN